MYAPTSTINMMPKRTLFSVLRQSVCRKTSKGLHPSLR
jgi:hypothetical protein